jgi:hypothetical protein
MNEAAKIWAEAIRETGIWLSPFADNVVELGRLIIPRMQEAIDDARAEQRWRDAQIAEPLDPAVAAAIRHQGSET